MPFLTLNPMGNDRGWRLWNTLARMRQKNKFSVSNESINLNLYRMSLSAHIHCGIATVFPAKNKRERSRTPDGIYRFLHIQMSSWRGNKAIILRCDRCEGVLGRFDI